jgi:hypothetical protein
MGPVMLVGETAYGLEWAKYSSQKKLLMALNGRPAWFFRQCADGLE